MCQENSRTRGWAPHAVVPTSTLMRECYYCVYLYTFFVCHCLLSFLADMYGLFNPSHGSIRFPVDHRSICPVYHMVFLHSMVGESRSIELCWGARTLTSGKGSLGFWLNIRSVFLQPGAKFSSCFPYIRQDTVHVDRVWCDKRLILRLINS